jgi:hypothetical protein
MTASTIQTSIRAAIKTAISSVAANVYDFVPAAPIVPFAAVSPSEPYLEINVLTKTGMRCRVNLLIHIGVGNQDNAAALDNLEKLLIAILTALPSGYEVGNISSPTVLSLASGSEILTSAIEISTQYTQTN